MMLGPKAQALSYHVPTKYLFLPNSQAQSLEIPLFTAENYTNGWYSMAAIASQNSGITLSNDPVCNNMLYVGSMEWKMQCSANYCSVYILSHVGHRLCRREKSIFWFFHSYFATSLLHLQWFFWLYVICCHLSSLTSLYLVFGRVHEIFVNLPKFRMQ